MIVSYQDKRTREFAEGMRVKASDGIHRRAELKLDQLDGTTSIRDRVLLGNRFEALEGDHVGQYRGQCGIRINDRWRICFEWSDRFPVPTHAEPAAQVDGAPAGVGGPSSRSEAFGCRSGEQRATGALQAGAIRCNVV